MRVLLIALLQIAWYAHAEDITRIWLTHKTNDPSKIVVNWETTQPGNSVVHYGTTAALGKTETLDESVTLHHVEIPLTEKDVVYHYRVQSGESKSVPASFKGYPSNELRVAVVADWGFGKPDLTALQKDNIHLLLTAGDNVPDLWNAGREGKKDATKAFSNLIDKHPELFRSTPLMPVLGNHDKEMRPRTDKPPELPVYDLDATAYCKFFELPGHEWRWHFDIPDFGVRLLALDLNHVQDLNTTWQSSQSYRATAAQFEWYKDIVEASKQPFLITIYNEQHSRMRGLERGQWWAEISKGSLAVTGFGYFAERADVNGFTCLNTSVSGKGSVYKDPKSVFVKSEDNYVLLTFKKGAEEFIAELKALPSGESLDKVQIKARKF